MKLFKKIVSTIKRPEVYVPVTMAIIGTCIYKIGHAQGSIDTCEDLNKEFNKILELHKCKCEETKEETKNENE